MSTEKVNDEKVNDDKVNDEKEDMYIPKTIETWEELEAEQELLRGIYAYGFEKTKSYSKKSDLSNI